MRQGEETLATKIDEMVRRIAERFDPEQIILKNAAYTLQMGRIALQTPYASMLSSAPKST
jgi:hypothetical protein